MHSNSPLSIHLNKIPGPLGSFTGKQIGCALASLSISPRAHDCHGKLCCIWFLFVASNTWEFGAFVSSGGYAILGFTSPEAAEQAMRRNGQRIPDHKVGRGSQGWQDQREKPNSNDKQYVTAKASKLRALASKLRAIWPPNLIHPEVFAFHFDT